MKTSLRSTAIFGFFLSENYTDIWSTGLNVLVVQNKTKTAKIKLEKGESFQIDVDINTWSGKEIFYFGKFELFSYRYFQQNVVSGSIVVDVGANIGFYSLMSAVLAGENGQI